MHVQDRLRAALVRKRASEVCWSCAFVRTHQIRWIRTVFTEHISQTLNSPPVEFSKYTAQDSDLSDSSKPTSSYVDGWSFRKQKVYSLPIRKVETFSPYFQRPLWRKLDSTPRQYQVYREGKGSHDTIKAQHKSNNMEPVGRRRLPDSTRASRNTSVRIRKIRESGSMKRSVAFRKVQSSRIRLMRPRFVELQKPPGALRAFRNTFVKFQKFREKGSIKRSVAMRYHRIRRRLRFVKSQKSVRLRKVGWYKPIFRKWLGLAKSHKERTRLGLLKESEELLDAYADIARSKYRINARSPRRTGAATRTRHGLNRMLQDSFNITQHVAATKDDADTKLENPMADHLVDPQESDPSENMAEQQAALSSASVNNLGQPNPLWTRSRPMGSSNAYCFGREDRFEASSIPGARLYSTQTTESAPDTYPLSSSGFEVAPKLPSVRDVGIREHLRLWQEGQSEPRATAPLSTLPGLRLSGSGENSLTQSMENDSVDTFDDAMSGEEDNDAFDSSEADIESQPYQQTYLEPGDVVQLNMPGEPIPTIFIRYLTDQAQFYSMTGEWIHRFSAFGGSFVIPRMFSPQELDPILPYLPSQEVDSKSLDKLQAISQDVPRDLAGALIEKLRGFQRACAEVHRQHLGRLVRMHSLVAYQSQTREMMLPEIASIVLQKPDPEELTEVMLWTTHAVLSRDMGFKRLNGMNHHIAPLWRVNSLHQMQKFEQVRNWVREYQEGVISQATALNDHGSPIDWQKYLMDVNPIPRFIQKTRRLIQDSRKHRSVVATSNIGPSRHKIAPKSLEHDAIVRETTLTKFNDMEKGIIGFLKSWCLTVEIQAGGDTWSLGPILLRAIGTYDGHELDARTAYLFLIEIGVCAPWDDRMCYDTNMHIPTSQDQKTKYLFDWAARRVTAIEHGSQPLQDSLASLRKDWANMAVYAIDSADAREIDDGISIEKIEGDESMFWVHVHIANPSAFVQPGDAVERYAARMISTVYTAETVYPMIDPRLSQAHFSLANNRPVLTVSIKLTVDGEIMERNLTPGWIHNLQRFTPTQVSQALGNDIDPPQAPSYVLKVGRSMGDTFNAADSTSLSSTAISDLRRLQQLGHARRIKRQGSIKSKINHLQGSLLVPDPHVYIQRGGLGPSYSPLHGRRFTGDPAISWEVKELSLDDQLTGVQHSLVSDMMMLACEAVGDWCSERNIPALYRGTEWNTTQPMLVEGYRAKFNAAVSVEHKFLYLRALSRSEGTATHKSMPVPHRLLGVPAYIQMTSPLRRYTDMLVHWQLQAALLHEASHGRDSLIGSRDDSYLPFSRARLDTLLPNISAHDRDVRRLSSRSKIHWILQLLSRAFYFKEAELPSTVDVFVLHDLSSTTKRNALGIVKQLNGYRTEVVHNDVAHREGGVKLGDWWQCRIQEVDTYQQHVLCLPIRLLKRDVPP